MKKKMYITLTFTLYSLLHLFYHKVTLFSITRSNEVSAVLEVMLEVIAIAGDI